MLVVAVEAVEVACLAGPLADRSEGPLAQLAYLREQRGHVLRASKEDLVLSLLSQEGLCWQLRDLGRQPQERLRRQHRLRGSPGHAG